MEFFHLYYFLSVFSVVIFRLIFLPPFQRFYVSIKSVFFENPIEFCKKKITLRTALGNFQATVIAPKMGYRRKNASCACV